MNTPLCRASDPITSFMAADRVKEFKHSHEVLIMDTLLNHGPAGVDAIAAHCGLLPHAVGKRIAALEAGEYIRQTGKLVKSDSGRMQREWESV
jgi:predicted ArsR family transcriptional regulator